jgi:ABC-type thiamin/hydroxymethylpyrimidine transport system permease subunit
MFKGKRYSTTNLLTTAVVAVIGGIVSAYAVLPWAKFIEGVLGPWGAALDNGFFTIWYIIIGLLTGSPGLTFIGGMLTGTVEVLAGSIDGPIVWVFVFFQSLGAEIGFLVMKYKQTLQSALLAGGLSGIGCGIPFIIIYGFSGLPLGLNILLFGALFVGNMILAGLLGYLIYKAVERTGVTGESTSV